MAKYKSQYTGPQIDQAVGNALNKDTSTLSNDVNHIPASSVVKSAINYVANRSLAYEHPASTYVASGTVTKVAEMSLDKGIWLIIRYANFVGNSNGFRRVQSLSGTTPGRNDAIVSLPPSSSDHYMQLVKFESISTNGTTIAEYVYQDSGISLTVWPRIEAIKVADL